MKHRTAGYINREELNFMRTKKTKSIPRAVPIEQRKDTNTSLGANSSSFGKKGSEKFFKFQQMSNLILNRVDDILSQFPSSGNVVNNLPEYSDAYLTSKNIISNIESTLPVIERSNTSSTVSRTRTRKTSNKSTKENGDTNSAGTVEAKAKNEEDENIDSNTDRDNIKRDMDYLRKKDTFITGVEVESVRSNLYSNKQPDDYLEENNKKIKEVLDTVNDLETYMKADEITSDISPEHQQDIRDFRNMMMEVEGYKRSIKDEFDELQYLIKFVDNTKTKVNRHMYGVSNVFNQTKLRPTHTNKVRDDEYEDSDNENNNNDDLIYNKGKNLSKIKDKLFCIQDNVINYHQGFSTRMVKIEKKNKKYKNIIYEDGKEKEKLNVKYDRTLPNDEAVTKKRAANPSK